MINTAHFDEGALSKPGGPPALSRNVNRNEFEITGHEPQFYHFSLEMI